MRGYQVRIGYACRALHAGARVVSITGGTVVVMSRNSGRHAVSLVELCVVILADGQSRGAHLHGDEGGCFQHSPSRHEPPHPRVSQHRAPHEVQGVAGMVRARYSPTLENRLTTFRVTSRAPDELLRLPLVSGFRLEEPGSMRCSSFAGDPGRVPTGVSVLEEGEWWREGNPWKRVVKLRDRRARLSPFSCLSKAPLSESSVEIGEPSCTSLSSLSESGLSSSKADVTVVVGTSDCVAAVASPLTVIDGRTLSADGVP